MKDKAYLLIWQRWGETGRLNLRDTLEEIRSAEMS